MNHIKRKKPLISLFIVIVMIGVLGIYVAVLLQSWLVVGALVPCLAAWITRFVVLFREFPPDSQ